MATTTPKRTQTTIEVLNSNNSIIASKTINSGNIYTDVNIVRGTKYLGKAEKTIFNLSGRAKVGQAKKIGTISFSADQTVSQNEDGLDNPTKYFKHTPYLIDNDIDNNSNRVVLKQSSVTKDANGNIIKYVFDIMYQISNSDNNGRLSYTIKEESLDKLEERPYVGGQHNVDIGSSIIQPGGEYRKITLTGTANNTFYIALTKLTDVYDSDGNLSDYSEENVLIDSVLASAFPNARTFKNQRGLHKDGSPATYTGLKSVSDKFSFYHHFPSTDTISRYVFRTKVTGGNEILVQENLASTILTEDKGWYKASSVNGPLYGGGWGDPWMYKVLTQVTHPSVQLTLGGTWTPAHLTITSSDGKYSSFSGASLGSPWTISTKTYVGKYNTKSTDIKTSTILKTFDFSYTFLASSGGFALRSGSDGAGGTLGNPVYSKVYGEESDWTNSVPIDTPAEGVVGNGGTVIDITGISSTISTTSSSNDTITIAFSVDVVEWGARTFIMALDVDKIATLS
jgi:hypothetical protein